MDTLDSRYSLRKKADLTKQAALGDLWRLLGKGAGKVGAGASYVGGELKKPMKEIWPYLALSGLIGAGTAAASSIGDTVERAQVKSTGFKRMLKANPDLREQEDEIKPYFKALVHFSPHVAAEPLAAGAFVRRMKEFSGVGLPITDVSTLSGIEKSRKDRLNTSRQSMLRDLRGLPSYGDINKEHELARKRNQGTL